MSQLVTGEAVVLQVRLARMPTRALAVTLDVILQLVVLGILIAMLVAFLSEASEALAAAIIVVTVVLVMVGYRLVMETLTRGQTLGKMALGLRVVRDDGSAIRFRQALVRTLLWLFVDFAPWFACCPGIVSSLMNKQGKRIGDMLAGTVVIRERHQPMASPPLFVPGPLVAWAGSLELSRLTDDLANTAREYLARFTELEPAAREALGNALAYRVGDVTAPAPPAPLSAPAFLSAVLAERRRRELNRLAAGQTTGGVYGAHAPGSYGPGGPFGRGPAYGPGGTVQVATVPAATAPALAATVPAATAQVDRSLVGPARAAMVPADPVPVDRSLRRPAVPTDLHRRAAGSVPQATVMDRPAHSARRSRTKPTSRANPTNLRHPAAGPHPAERPGASTEVCARIASSARVRESPHSPRACANRQGFGHFSGDSRTRSHRARRRRVGPVPTGGSPGHRIVSNPGDPRRRATHQPGRAAGCDGLGVRRAKSRANAQERRRHLAILREVPPVSWSQGPDE